MFMSTLQRTAPVAGEPVIGELCHLPWPALGEVDLLGAASAYYYFSIQFRENLAIACAMFPGDAKLALLRQEECDTDSLSPYPGIAAAGEKLDHDEFLRRAMRLSPAALPRLELRVAGEHYLAAIRAMPRTTRAASIASYKNGGLLHLFNAILQAPIYKNPALAAFRYFMQAHIQFDTDPIEGHGKLSRHLGKDENTVPLWEAFKRLLLASAPGLETNATREAPRASEFA